MRIIFSAINHEVLKKYFLKPDPKLPTLSLIPNNIYSLYSYPTIEISIIGDLGACRNMEDSTATKEKSTPFSDLFRCVAPLCVSKDKKSDQFPTCLATNPLTRQPPWSFESMKNNNPQTLTGQGNQPKYFRRAFSP